MPPGPRRRRDERPEIEVLGAGGEDESVREVPIGGGGAPRWWLGGIAVVALLIAGGVAFGGGRDDGGGEPSSGTSTRPTAQRPITTLDPGPATTTTLVLGPLLPERTGATLVVTNDSRRWRVVDLDTGTAREVAVEADDPFFGTVPVRGGVVTRFEERARFVPLIGGGAPVDLASDVGPVMSAGLPDAVWVGPAGYEDGEVRLVGLDGRVRPTRRVPQALWGGSAIAEGMLTSAGGDTFVIGPSGPRSIGHGTSVAQTATEVLLDSCGADGACDVVRVDTVTGTRTVLTALRHGVLDPGFATYAITPAGEVVRVTMMTPAPDQARVRWVSPDGYLVADGVVPYSTSGAGGLDALVCPLPGRLGLLWATAGSKASLLRPDGNRIVVTDLPLPHDWRITRLMLISP